MNNPKLLPCPFCGGKAELMTHYDLDPDIEIVACTKCGARGPEYVHDGEMLIVNPGLAVVTWNKRAEIKDGDK